MFLEIYWDSCSRKKLLLTSKVDYETNVLYFSECNGNFLGWKMEKGVSGEKCNAIMQKRNVAMWEIQEENEAREVGQKKSSKGTWL